MKKKVLHVANYLIPNATYQENMLLHEHSKNKSFKSYIISVAKNFPNEGGYEVLQNQFLSRDIPAGVKTENGAISYRLEPRFEKRQRIWLKGLINTINEINPDVILVHGATNLNTIRICLHKKFSKNANYRLLVDDHITSSIINKSFAAKIFYRFYRFFIAKLVSDQTDLFIPVGQEIKSVMQKIYGLKGKFKIIEHGADNRTFFYDKDRGQKFIESKNIPKESFIFCYSGKVIPSKKIELLIEAFSSVNMEHPDCVLIICGPSDELYLSHLKKSVPRSLEHRVFFIGNQTSHQLSILYNASDVAVWPEGVTMSSIEAGLCGLPAIMRNLPINAERLEGGKSGILFNTDEELADCMSSIIKNKKLLRVMQQRRLDYSSQYSWEKVAARFTDSFFNEI